MVSRLSSGATLDTCGCGTTGVDDGTGDTGPRGRHPSTDWGSSVAVETNPGRHM